MFKLATSKLTLSLLERNHNPDIINTGWKSHLQKYSKDKLTNYKNLSRWFRKMMCWAFYTCKKRNLLKSINRYKQKSKPTNINNNDDSNNVDNNNDNSNDDNNNINENNNDDNNNDINENNDDNNNNNDENNNLDNDLNNFNISQIYEINDITENFFINNYPDGITDNNLDNINSNDSQNISSNDTNNNDHDELKKCLLSLYDFQNIIPLDNENYDTEMLINTYINDPALLNIQKYMKHCCNNIKLRRKTLVTTYFCNICKQTISNKQSHINQAFQKHGCLNIANLYDYIMNVKNLGVSNLPQVLKLNFPNNIL